MRTVDIAAQIRDAVTGTSVVLSLAVLAGCGQTDQPDASSSVATPSTSVRTSTPTSTSAGPSTAQPKGPYPIKVSRTGGVAGLHEVILVQSDGTVMIDQKKGPDRTCQLTDAYWSDFDQQVNKPDAWQVPTSSSDPYPTADALITRVADAKGRVPRTLNLHADLLHLHETFFPQSGVSPSTTTSDCR